MECKKENIDTNNYSSKKYYLQTEQARNKIALFKLNLNDKYNLTIQELNNQQKLLDFISDKKKLSLKSYFDQGGSKAFLNGKDEAMRKIELNENIEEKQINKKLTKKKNKKIYKMNSAEYIETKKDKINSIIKYKSIKEKKNGDTNYKLTNIHEKINDNDSKNIIISDMNKQKQIKPKSILKKKLCKKKNDMNISKSIISVLTIDSTLFNNEKDYKKYQKLTTNDDLPIIQGILCELGDNKK